MDKVSKWAKDCGLSFSPQKTHGVLFTHKCKIPDMDISLVIDNTEINYIDTAKCLGVTFDSKLSWSQHIDNEIKATLSPMISLEKTSRTVFDFT